MIGICLILFFLVSIESICGVNASRTHGAQGDQLVFQRVVVRERLEHPARRRCRHGICRIILVFAPPSARATRAPGKAGKEKLIFQCVTACICFVLYPSITRQLYRGVARQHSHSPSERGRTFLRSHLLQYLFHLAQIRQTNATRNGRRRPNTKDQ